MTESPRDTLMGTDFPYPENDRFEAFKVAEPSRINPISEKSFDFALKVIELYKNLAEQREWVISKQLLRSGTSIGANVEEALAAESRKDFIHKMNLALKETRETTYWLRLLHHSNLTNSPDLKTYLDEADQLRRILTSIIKTTQGKPRA